MFFTKSLTLALAASLCIGTSSIVMPIKAEAASKRTCQAYAKKKANKRAGARQVVGSAVVGAGVGAIAGAVIGGRRSVARGAIFGGVAGTAVGAATTNSRWRGHYEDAYAYCRQHL